jgi:hypothetical protein
MLRWLKTNLTISTQLKLTVFMTFFDLMMTLVWIYSGNATEANPILRYTLEQSASKFIFVKLAMSLGAIWIFYKNQAHRLVRATVPFIFTSYGFLTIFHLYGLVFYLSYFNFISLVSLNYL